MQCFANFCGEIAQHAFLNEVSKEVSVQVDLDEVPVLACNAFDIACGSMLDEVLLYSISYM